MCLEHSQYEHLGRSLRLTILDVNAHLWGLSFGVRLGTVWTTRGTGEEPRHIRKGLSLGPGQTESESSA